MITYRRPDGGPRILDEEQVLYQGAGLRIGLFEARTDDPHFRFSAVPEEYLLVFPCTSARIEHDGRPGFVADRNVVTYYNPSQLYRRAEVSARGDRAHWFALSPRTLDRVLRELGRRPGRAEPRFGFARGPSDAASYRLQRDIVHRLVAGAIEPPALEAAVPQLASRVIAAACEAEEREGRAREPAIDLVERARDLLARRYAEPLTLEDLAERLDCSASRLCHTFREVTGTTLHAHRDQLRLRRALLELPERRGRFTELGLELGYSSHSHFTERFRRAFGRPPAAI